MFLHDVGLVALHEEVGEKKNELSTLRDRLAWLVDRYPGLWLLCGDAMFADQTLCKRLNYHGRRRRPGRRHPQTLANRELPALP